MTTKLKAFQKRNIRILYEHGAEVQALAWLFGVSEQEVLDVLGGR